jgi:hypothetical protein
MHLDPEFSAIVFGGMIERVRQEVGMIDWRQLVTTAVATGITTVAVGYVAIKDTLADHKAEIVEIKTMITSRVAQRESQLQAIAERDAQMASDIIALQTEDMRVRQDMLICRETIAEMRARHERR